MSLADQIKQECARTIDNTAETTRELQESTGYSRSWVKEFATAKVRSGEWERVWKRIGRNLIPAYRRKVSNKTVKSGRVW